MKLCRYQEHTHGPVRLGVVRDGFVHDVTLVTEDLTAVRWPFPPGDQLIANLDNLRPAMEALADRAEPVTVASVLLRCPIANPGRASLEAVLNPERHDYIFFVADGTGGHVFAATLQEHNNNVAKWREIRKNNENAQ